MVEPFIVRYECDNSFEVVEAPESRLKPKTGDDEPTPWGTVSWESIQNQCFRGDPRRLARYRDQGRPAQAADVPGSSARVAEKKEVPIIEESPPPEPANPNQEISEPPAKKAKKETPKAPEVAIREPEKIISSSSPIELLSTYAAGGSAIFSDTLEKKSSPFLSSSPFSEDIVKATIAIESYQPVSTKDSYKAAVAKFLDYIKVAEVDDKAFIDPSLTEQIMVGFFVSRIGRVPQLTAKLHWRDVAPATAKTEVSAVIAALRLLGLPPPSFSALHTVFKKSGALRKAPHSEKLPLFANNLDRMWRSLPEMKTEAISVRNFALCVTTYFFMLRGGESRMLRRNQLELLKTHEPQTWRVTLDHSKSDPLVLGKPPPGGSWTGFCSNAFFSEVMDYYLKSFLSSPYPDHLPLFPQVETQTKPHNPADQFSRKAPGAPHLSWRIIPVETFVAGKKKGGFLTTSDRVNKWLKEKLPKIHISTHHTMHSLRVGAATEALSLGASLSQIQAMGHWKSMAVLTYAVDSLSSIEEMTRAFGSKDLVAVNGVIDVKQKIERFLKDDEDGENEDGDDSKGTVPPSLSP